MASSAPHNHAHARFLDFTKMHGHANDFMISYSEERLHVTKETVIKWADRRRGVGFDQLLLVHHTEGHGADRKLVYAIYNSDGTAAEQCGNGARCVARLLFDAGHTKISPEGDARSFTIYTDIGRVPINAVVEADGQVSVNLGRPSPIDLLPQCGPGGAVPLLDSRLDGEWECARCVNVTTPWGTFDVVATSMGNPHGVVFVEDVHTIPFKELGEYLQNRHLLFRDGANVEFVQAATPQHAVTRIMERGAGETDCCGSGACAVGVAMFMRYGTQQTRVSMPGGDLQVALQVAEAGRGDIIAVTLKGPAEYCYSGRVQLD